MAIIADVKIKTAMGETTIPSAYVSPILGAHNTKDHPGWYALHCWHTRGGVPIPVPQINAGLLFTDPSLPVDYPARQPGVVYDRAKSAHKNIYADLAIKIAAGKVPWLTNVRNEDGSPFVDGAAAPAAAPEPEPEPAPASEPEHAFADLMLADETRDAELEALRARIAELEAAPVLELSNDPPAEALMEAYPDEDHAALKARILAEFASLRNMLVGHIPMTMEQLARLQALEHPRFQTWLQA